MSTKIYYAWKVRHREFATLFLPAFREHVFGVAASRIRKVMKYVTAADARRAGTRFCKSFRIKLGNRLDRFCRAIVAFELCGEASAGSTRDYALDVDACLHVWLHRGHAYVIPIGESCMYSNFGVPCAEDYCYYNNTDRPKDVSARQWAVRARRWDAVCLTSWNETRLQHSAIDLARHIGVYDVAIRLFTKTFAEFLDLWVDTRRRGR